MLRANIKDFIGGWFVGNFEPTLFKTRFIEVAHHKYTSGHKSDGHYHREATEINYIVKGRARVNGFELESGDIWVYFPCEITDVEFLENTDLIIIKSPSCQDDKYYPEKNFDEKLISLSEELSSSIADCY